MGGVSDRIGDDAEVKRTQQESPCSDTSKLEVTCETPGRGQKPERPLSPTCRAGSSGLTLY